MDWGVIIGGIGALTGIVSLIEVRKLKSQDLRMNRGSMINSIKISLEELKLLGEEANKSRINCLAARGRFHSGDKISWENFYAEKKDHASNLEERFLRLKAHKPKFFHLENHVLELDNIEKRFNNIITDYKKSIAEDKRASGRLASAFNSTKKDIYETI